jgi:hypothetical protein
MAAAFKSRLESMLQMMEGTAKQGEEKKFSKITL